MREDSDLGQLGAFSRNRAPASFSALDRSNTDSAKNTPKSDMDLLACIQHLASLNWAFCQKAPARSIGWGVLSLATTITVFASAIALVLLLVVIACRSTWRQFRQSVDVRFTDNENE
jgi:hypothetical protein